MLTSSKNLDLGTFGLILKILVNHLLFYFNPLCFLKPPSDHDTLTFKGNPCPNPLQHVCLFAKPSVLHLWDP